MARSARIAMVLVVALIAGVGMSAFPGFAASTEVGPGDSIQAAIDAAAPGDTIVVKPGVYRESLFIQKNGITLQGAGASPDGTVLAPPAGAVDSLCAEPGAVPGICVVAKEADFETGEVITPVRNVRITGFLVRNFSGDGIISFGANALPSTTTSLRATGATGLPRS